MDEALLNAKQTVLDLHEIQKTDTHVYFQYEGDEDLYRVGYYMPLTDWIEMGTPNQIMVRAVAGIDGLPEKLRDEGEYSEPVPYDGPKNFLDKINAIQPGGGCTEIYFTNGASICSAGNVVQTETQIVPSLRFEE